MLVITGHQPSPLNSVELYFGLICPRICYWTKQSQNGFVLARRHSSVHNVQMMSPAELRFAVVKLNGVWELVHLEADEAHLPVRFTILKWYAWGFFSSFHGYFYLWVIMWSIHFVRITVGSGICACSSESTRLEEQLTGLAWGPVRKLTKQARSYPPWQESVRWSPQMRALSAPNKSFVQLDSAH